MIILIFILLTENLNNNDKNLFSYVYVIKKRIMVEQFLYERSERLFWQSPVEEKSKTKRMAMLCGSGYQPHVESSGLSPSIRIIGEFLDNVNVGHGSHSRGTRNFR